MPGAGDSAMKPTKKSKQAREAATYVKTLKANRQIARGKKLTPGTTHQMVTDAKGKKVVVRRRYSAT